MTITVDGVMINIDTRWLAYMIWGVGTVIVYGLVLRKGYRSFHAHRDGRSRRELIARTARFMVAVASAAGILFALYGEPGTGFRALVISLALGAFTAAGVIEFRDEPEDPEADY